MNDKDRLVMIRGILHAVERGDQSFEDAYYAIMPLTDQGRRELVCPSVYSGSWSNGHTRVKCMFKEGHGPVVTISDEDPEVDDLGMDYEVWAHGNPKEMTWWN